MSTSSGAQPERPAPPSDSFLWKLSDLGAPAQAAIPGLYAWSVTVAPVAWSRAAPWAAQALAVVGAAALLGAPWLARRAPSAARILSIGGLVGTSVVVWLLVPAALAPGRLDAMRAVAGMIGWGLFALATAAPALKRVESVRPPEAIPLAARTELRRGDLAYVGAGVALATLLQVVGWRPMPTERALLVRMVALAAAIGVVSASTAMAISRHGRRPRATRRVRLKRALLWLVFLGLLLAGAGVLLLR